ncbi:MAG TPA: circularly permuted type 2 ATP-grasp protein [Terriglobia bacterium]|nr:circularly permuted type 2 ATP-grasp protein [Terriglobia bacterium]
MITTSESERTPLRYSGITGHWDEAVLPSGMPRRHWRDLYVEVGRMGLRQLNRRWHSGQQLIQSEGITYNPANLPEGSEYTWPMDPIPLAIGHQEWASIETAVAQRATLLNAILSDLYGNQRLLHERHVPSPLVFANPNFLRPCFGFQPAGGVHLQTYAVDIARSTDGRWWALADRTQAPSGMGYTLQNRLITARTLPGVFNQCRVRQLARFFDMKREVLLSLASQRSNPTVVVLTPGPHNETYFEQSFLAGQWGFTLVEGADLTVLDRRVYVKTLGGLRQVDVILRRLDDDFCDPLELRGDSLLGVPGLVDAARSGSVAIDNALGSGLVETSALMAFLPELCRHLLGEELKMPSVATWWCGQEEPLGYVREHLANLVIKPAFSRYGHRTEFPDVLDETGRNNLLARIAARPEDFVAQERVALSTAPVFNENGFVPRHVIVRIYAAWNGRSYSVLPGGLTRVSSQDSTRSVSMQLGGGSKDTWVFSGVDEPAAVRRTGVLPKGPRVAARELPSRVADNLFWLGRYTERVESRVRFARVLLPTLSGEEDFGSVASLETATRLLAGLGYLPPETAFASLGEQHWRVQRTLTEMIYDPSQMSSLRWNLKEMRRAAWHLKERLSLDTWRVLQQLEAQFSRVPPASVDHRYLAGMDLLDSVVVTLSAFSGLLTENTTRGYGWLFLEIGRRMERALQTSELLSSGLASAPSDPEPHLQVLLQIADSSITYRRRYPTMVEVESVLEVLMTDETNPRAVAFQLATLLQEIDRLQEIAGEGQGTERELASRALASIRKARVADLAERNTEGRFTGLDELIGELRWTLYEISDVLTASYLSHLTASRLTVSW